MARPKTIPNFATYNILLWIGGGDITKQFRGSTVPITATFPEIRVIAAIHGQDRIEAIGPADSVAVNDQELFDTLVRKYGYNGKTKESFAAETFPGFASGEIETLPRKAAGAWAFLATTEVVQAGATIAELDEDESDDETDEDEIQVEEVDPYEGFSVEETTPAEEAPAPALTKKTGR